MIKKLLPLTLLCAQSHASLLPFDFSIEQQDPHSLEFFIHNPTPHYNITQLYLKQEDTFFKDLKIDSDPGDTLRLFTNSMRIYDGNRDEKISLKLNFDQDILFDSIGYGIGYYKEGGVFVYEQGSHEINSKPIVPVSEPNPLGIIGLGLLTTLYFQRRDRSQIKLRET